MYKINVMSVYVVNIGGCKLSDLGIVVASSASSSAESRNGGAGFGFSLFYSY
jgi:hypothetical protein